MKPQDQNNETQNQQQGDDQGIYPSTDNLDQNNQMNTNQAVQPTTQTDAQNTVLASPAQQVVPQQNQYTGNQNQQQITTQPNYPTPPPRKNTTLKILLIVFSILTLVIVGIIILVAIFMVPIIQDSQKLISSKHELVDLNNRATFIGDFNKMCVLRSKLTLTSSLAETSIDNSRSVVFLPDSNVSWVANEAADDFTFNIVSDPVPGYVVCVKVTEDNFLKDCTLDGASLGLYSATYELVAYEVGSNKLVSTREGVSSKADESCPSVVSVISSDSNETVSRKHYVRPEVSDVVSFIKELPSD